MITQLEFNDLQKDELSKLISRVTISPYTDYKLFKQSITELIENGLEFVLFDAFWQGQTAEAFCSVS